MAALSSVDPLVHHLNIFCQASEDYLNVNLKNEAPCFLSIKQKIKEIKGIIQKKHSTFSSFTELMTRKSEILPKVDEIAAFIFRAQANNHSPEQVRERTESFHYIVETIKTIQHYINKGSHRAPAMKSATKPVKYVLGREWFNNAKYWQRFIAIHPNISLETRQDLTFFAMRYFSTVANLDMINAINIKRHINSLQNLEYPNYYRENQYNTVLDILRVAIQKELDPLSCPNRLSKLMIDQPLFLLNGHQFKNFLQHSHDYQNITLNSDHEWDSCLNLNDDCESDSSFKSDGNLEIVKQKIYEIISDMRISFNRLNEVFFHIRLPKLDSNREIVPFFQKILKKLRAILQEQVREYIEKINPRISGGDIQSDIDAYLRHITIGSFINVQEQEVLLVNSALHTSDVRFTMLHSEHVRKKIKDNGFTLTLQDTMRKLARQPILLNRMVANLSESIKHQEHALEGFLPLDRLFPFIGSLNHLIHHPTYTAFKKVFSGISPISFLTNTLCRLIEGFPQIPLERSFYELHIQDALKDSFGRVLNYIERALDLHNTDVDIEAIREYENIFEQIFEEILLWLSISKPYIPGSLEKLIVKAVSSKSGITPQHIRFTHTGTRAIFEIIQVILKVSHIDHKKTNALIMNDCYWEILETLEQLTPSKKFNQSFIVRNIDYLAEHIQDLKENNEKINLLLIDFHASYTVGKLEYKVNDIALVIHQLLEAGVTEKPLTVAIDTTIGCQIQSDELDHLLTVYRDKILNGELNIITYMSHQKFDSFGTDRISGGSYCVYSSYTTYIEEFQNLNLPLDGFKADKPDDFNYQAFAHIYQTALPSLEEYRQRIVANAHYVYDLISPNMKYNPEIAKPAQLVTIARKSDKQMHCLSFVMNPRGIAPHFQERLIDTFADNIMKSQLPINYRASYGYRITTYTTIFSNLRLSVGIENRALLNKLVAVINETLTEINAIPIPPPIPPALGRV